MNREALDRFCERGILGLVLVILVFGPCSTGAVRTQEFLVIQALTAGVLVLWGARLWLSERPQFLWTPLCWVALAFAAYALGRYVTCDIEYVGRLELLHILVYAFLFFAVLNNLYRQESILAISYTAISVAMVISFVAVWQFLAGAGKVPSLGAFAESLIFPHKSWSFPRAYSDRASGTYINPNHLAGFLEMLLPLALAQTLAGRGKTLHKVLLGYAALAMVAGIGVSVSRGSWAATTGALLVFFGVLALYRSYRLPSLLLMMMVVAVSTFFVTRTPFFKERFRVTFASGRLDLNVRAELWDATVRMWNDHKWWGVGPGHYDYRFRVYRPQDVQLRPDRAHNEYLNLLADWGVAGAAIIGTGLVAMLAGVAKTWRHVRRVEAEFKSNYSNKFAFVLGAAFGLLALLAHSAVDFNLQIPANAILAVTLASLLSSHLRFATEKYWVRAGVALRTFASLIFLAGIVFVAQQTMRLGREYVWLERAATKPSYSDARIADLEKAHAAEPRNFETAYALGEAYRVQSFEGGEDYRELAAKAMQWFSRGTNSNPYDQYNFLGTGRCLDWLGKFEEARPYYFHADELDPNGYFTSAFVGWHYIQIEDYAAARPWLERSLKFQRQSNEIAESYLQIATRKLLEAATNQLALPPR